ncbi:MAG: PBECR2 nuclease fold domain-containing protein [Candidatus Pacearchaeota archaeon]
MDYLFEIIDKTGRKIRLTKERWTHITSPESLHPYMANYLEEVKIAIIKPDAVVPNKFDDTKANYYRYLKDRKKYLLVAVKYLNGEGFITTAFTTRKIKKR